MIRTISSRVVGTSGSVCTSVTSLPRPSTTLVTSSSTSNPPFRALASIRACSSSSRSTSACLVKLFSASSIIRSKSSRTVIPLLSSTIMIGFFLLDGCSPARAFASASVVYTSNFVLPDFTFRTRVPYTTWPSLAFTFPRNRIPARAAKEYTALSLPLFKSISALALAASLVSFRR